jgi:hypothetical protein
MAFRDVAYLLRMTEIRRSAFTEADIDCAGNAVLVRAVAIWRVDSVNDAISLITVVVTA